ncbi:redoxin family protein [Sphingomonas pokkalii]|uniref:DsbE family thiol:disulfide interchange protein n=1 Tax=Sphingomonas pokkalii TaxID=2175090 RepID=A0A2U0SJU2_9SPHN|nr:redoxin family protein [Sphingomonas pokkalii]PVX31621.1 DsbE family thiol:disulfide interchange protein [Sphingomonas pokkalii]
MKKLLIWLPLGLFVIVFALVVNGLIEPSDRLVRSAMVGKPLPALRLPPLLPDKDGIDTSATRSGKPRMLNVFASWCIPCVAEAPQLMKLKQAGAEIDAIAVRDTTGDVQAFLARNGDPYTRIGDDRAMRAQLSLGSSGVPETFVIDSRGVIVDQHIGDIRAEDVPKLLAALEKAK